MQALEPPWDAASCPRAAAAPPAAQELETMRVQNEQLAARLFTVEQRNSEMARDHAQSALAGSQQPTRPPVATTTATLLEPSPWTHEEIPRQLAAEKEPRRVLWCLPKVTHPTAFYRAGAREQRTARRRGLGRTAHPSRRTSCDARRRRAAHAADTRAAHAARHPRLGGAAEGARGTRLRRGAAQAEPPAAGEPHEHATSGESLGSGEGEGLEQRRTQSVHAPTQRQR